MRKLTTEGWIEKAKTKHGNIYNYSLVNYKGKSTKVTIICPIHGEFEQTPDTHANRGDGCPKCRLDKLTTTTEEFIKQANIVHNNKFSYKNTKYTLAGNKLTVTCPEHGDFEVRANQHLAGQDCNKCSIKHRTVTTEEFIQKSRVVHKDKYSYTSVKYITSSIKVKIICNKCNSVFKMRPSDHLLGAGCPSCAKRGFDQTKSAILYYLKITTDKGLILYKIGITNRSVNERFQLTDLSKIEIVKQEEFALGSDALAKETEIKRKFKEFQYKGPDVLSSGNTELFTKDILAQF